MEKVHHNPTSQAIWNWQGNASGPETRPGHSRRTAVIGLVIGTSAAGLLFFFHHRAMAAVVLTVAVTIFACALFFPRAYRAIQIFFQKLSFWVGQALTWILLVPFFYLCFTGGRIVQKIAGRDPMTRTWHRDAPTYWIDHQTVTDKDQYKRQF